MGADVPQERVQPAAPSWAAPRQGRHRDRKTFKSPSSRRSSPGPDQTPQGPQSTTARRSIKRSGHRVALKCIHLPSNRGGGEGKEEKERGASDRQEERGGRTQSAARPPARPRPALSVRPAPPPPPRTAPPHTPSAGARPSARAFVHIQPPPPGRAPWEESREWSRVGGTRHPPRQPRGGARPADSFPTRAGPSGETGGGEGRGGNGRSARDDSPG